MPFVISVRNISKRYRLGAALGHDTLRDHLGGAAKAVKGFLRGQRNGSSKKQEELWAVRDISFDVQQGDVIGIIGRNGAGKSTLLKILSQITEPTTGEIHVRGRIASLLEVGTGFHPELSGRENIFLNGAILGMTQAEIRKKFDEIVAFAEVEKFLDTPVKRYSSGMYVRLAFAVAAHLEPEILIVDEVLAVGDAQFQKKCLGKMREVSTGGRTVIFVSHNMATIKTLCSRAIVLESGRVVCESDTDTAIARYFASNKSREDNLAQRTDRLGNGSLRFTAVRFVNKAGNCVEEITSGDPLTIEVDYKTDQVLEPQRMILAFSFWDSYQTGVALFASDEMGTHFKPFGEKGTIRIKIPELLLRGGAYSLKLIASYSSIRPENFADVVEEAASLRILSGDYWESGRPNREGPFCVIDAEMSNHPI